MLALGTYTRRRACSTDDRPGGQGVIDYLAEFLPARRAVGRQEPLGSLPVLDALALGRGRWLLVLEAGSRLLASAVVEDGMRFRRAAAGNGLAEELLARVAREDASGMFSFRRLGPIEHLTGKRPIEINQSKESIVVGGWQS